MKNFKANLLEIALRLKHIAHTVQALVFYRQELDDATKSPNWAILAYHKNSRIREEVAFHIKPKSIHPQDFKNASHELSLDSCSRVRLALASNPFTEPKSLSTILVLNPPVADIYTVIASRIDTNPNDLDALAYERDPLVRLLVATHPNVSSETLDMLACDIHPEVRLMVSRHPTAKVSTLEILTRGLPTESYNDVGAFAVYGAIQRLHGKLLEPWMVSDTEANKEAR